MAHHVKAHHGGSISDIARATRKISNTNYKDTRTGLSHQFSQDANHEERNESNTDLDLGNAPTNNTFLQANGKGHIPGIPDNSRADILSSLLPGDVLLPAEPSLQQIASWDAAGTDDQDAVLSSLAEEEPGFSFLAQTDANITDAEMIWLAQHANSIRGDFVTNQQNVF